MAIPNINTPGLGGGAPIGFSPFSPAPPSLPLQKQFSLTSAQLANANTTPIVLVAGISGVLLYPLYWTLFVNKLANWSVNPTVSIGWSVSPAETPAGTINAGLAVGAPNTFVRTAVAGSISNALDDTGASLVLKMSLNSAPDPNGIFRVTLTWIQLVP